MSAVFDELVRKVEPWSTYTEGWNDALDIAEQAVIAALRNPSDELVDCVAAAMHEAGASPDDDTDWTDEAEIIQAGYRHMARAVLAALADEYGVTR